MQIEAQKIRTAIALWADDLGLELSQLDADMLIDRIRSISTVTPAEVGGLVAGLRSAAGRLPYKAPAAINYRRAATALEAQAAELAAVKAERDDLEVLKNMYRDDTESAKARLAKALKALEPFADIAGEPWADESGWTDAACQNDRICDWFGPSNFLAARRALTGGKDDG